MTSLSWPEEHPAHGRVVLRPFAAGDVDMVQDLATDVYVPTIYSVPFRADEKQARAWIRSQQPRLVDLIGYSFCIADAETGEALGQVGLWPREIAEGRAVVGYAVAPRARGRHAAHDALVAVTRFAWTIDRLHRLEAFVEPWNDASIHIVERAGYQREGLLRQRQLVGCERHDVLLFSRLRCDGPLPV